MEGRYRMIQGSEEAVLWLQLSEPLTVGMFGDLRRMGRREEKRKRKRENNRKGKRENNEMGLMKEDHNVIHACFFVFFQTQTNKSYSGGCFYRLR